MHFPVALTSALVIAGSTLAQGQYNYGSAPERSNNYGSSTASSVTAAGVSQQQPTTTVTASTVSLTATTSAPAGSSSAGTKVHVVQVGNGGLTFSPADIKAAQGDVVQFQFYPQNHSVVQSTFDNPCEPIAKNMPGTAGFFSGFMPVAANSNMIPSYSIAINDTKPIWFYCSQGKHCQQGMVGVINAPAANASRTLESHKALAAKVGQTLSPGQPGTVTNSTGGSAGGSGSRSSSSGPSTLTSSTSGAQQGSPSATGSVRTNSSVPLTNVNGAGSDKMGGQQMYLGAGVAAGMVALVMGGFM